jgi:aspartyl-tRNA(Asn)/glutamyl-tRNA(Gln) amidotransferase subunit C
MQITNDTIKQLANLARLEFSEEELPQIRKDLEKMISFVEKLGEIDTTGVEPLLHMTTNTDMLREDELSGSISREEGLQNAGDKNQEYFFVPKVIKK